MPGPECIFVNAQDDHGIHIALRRNGQQNLLGSATVDMFHALLALAENAG
jgi:hypothetical protein